MSAEKTVRFNPYIETPFQNSLHALWPAANVIECVREVWGSPGW